MAGLLGQLCDQEHVCHAGVSAGLGVNHPDATPSTLSPASFFGFPTRLLSADDPRPLRIGLIHSLYKGPTLSILAEGATALSVTLSEGALFAS